MKIGSGGGGAFIDLFDGYACLAGLDDRISLIPFRELDVSIQSALIHEATHQESLLGRVGLYFAALNALHHAYVELFVDGHTGRHGGTYLNPFPDRGWFEAFSETLSGPLRGFLVAPLALQVALEATAFLGEELGESVYPDAIGPLISMLNKQERCISTYGFERNRTSTNAQKVFLSSALSTRAYFIAWLVGHRMNRSLKGSESKRSLALFQAALFDSSAWLEIPLWEEAASEQIDGRWSYDASDAGMAEVYMDVVLCAWQELNARSNNRDARPGGNPAAWLWSYAAGDEVEDLHRMIARVSERIRVVGNDNNVRTIDAVIARAAERIRRLRLMHGMFRICEYQIKCLRTGVEQSDGRELVIVRMPRGWAMEYWRPEWLRDGPHIPVISSAELAVRLHTGGIDASALDELIGEWIAAPSMLRQDVYDMRSQKRFWVTSLGSKTIALLSQSEEHAPGVVCEESLLLGGCIDLAAILDRKELMNNMRIVIAQQESELWGRPSESVMRRVMERWWRFLFPSSVVSDIGAFLVDRSHWLASDRPARAWLRDALTQTGALADSSMEARINEAWANATGEPAPFLERVGERLRARYHSL